MADVTRVIKIRLKKIDSSHPAFQGHWNRPAIYDFLLVFSGNFVPKHTVFEIFDFRNAVTLRTGLEGPSMSFEMSPFDRAHTTFC